MASLFCQATDDSKRKAEKGMQGAPFVATFADDKSSADPPSEKGAFLTRTTFLCLPGEKFVALFVLVKFVLGRSTTYGNIVGAKIRNASQCNLDK